MGKAERANPMSPKFKGVYEEDVLMTGVMVNEQPTPEWMMAHPDAANTGEKPGPEDTRVMLVATVQRIEPSALYPGQPDKWPRSKIITLGPILYYTPDGKAVPAIATMAEWRKITPIEGRVVEVETAKESDAQVS